MAAVFQRQPSTAGKDEQISPTISYAEDEITYVEVMTDSGAQSKKGGILENGHARQSTVEEPSSKQSDAGLTNGHKPYPASVENDLGSAWSEHTKMEGSLGKNADFAETSTTQSGESRAETMRGRDSSQGAGTQDAEMGQDEVKEKVLKLSPAKIFELTSSPKSLPLRKSFEKLNEHSILSKVELSGSRERASSSAAPGKQHANGDMPKQKDEERSGTVTSTPMTPMEQIPVTPMTSGTKDSERHARPHSSGRTFSTPLLRRRASASRGSALGKPPQAHSTKHSKTTPLPLPFGDTKTGRRLSSAEDPEASPMPPSIPLPPLSLPTYLQLELSSQPPSPLYIHRSATSDFPYESSRVKIERLQNFLLLPPQLEQVLWFGALACLDAWLFSFTILPLRFLKALSILCHSWGRNLVRETKFIGAFIYAGVGRMWLRRRRLSISGSSTPSLNDEDPIAQKDASENVSTSKFEQSDRPNATHAHPEVNRKHHHSSTQRHRRSKSTPSALLPDHKADLLKGLLILISCTILMYFDASRMYHGIRGQAAIKLYVIYNVLEVCDRLFSALGQDVLECLFSKETLERRPDGRSKVLRPFWLFVLALVYNLVHSTALFYQVITLNVAVNSYSNALLTLLMSNQFVEIKSTVFKKFEKDNLFQLTCADVVERFQLWLMLTIIASRNIVETGGLSLGSSSGSADGGSASLGNSSILPKSFTLFPLWTGQVMGPFLLVLGSEMLVDWLKHAYITKFNNTKPAIYGRFLDVLAKDYYSNAFADHNLTRRLGLPVIPLACLFIRASVQTYHMFLATHMPLPLPSPATSLSVENGATTTSPATTAALHHIDHIFRRALGRSSFGAGSHPSPSFWSTDDIIALLIMLLFFLVFFLALLAFKLVLGMLLLSFARRRYRGMKEREATNLHAEGRRVGGWGVVEVDEDKRRWIYMDDPDGGRRVRERERQGRESGGGGNFGTVERYSMVGKRIW